jgi:enoyl-CoA hydratase
MRNILEISKIEHLFIECHIPTVCLPMASAMAPVPVNQRKKNMASESDEVLYESQDGIAVITINRQAQRNSVNSAVVQGLHAAWQRFSQDDTRVAVLTAAGDQAFCAGADLKDLPRDIWLAVPNLAIPCDKPIIAAVTGHAIGVGATIVMYCDMAVCTEDASFVYPEAKVGNFAGVMGGFPARMPYKIGLEWAVTGNPMTARRAQEIGFVNHVCEKGQQVEVSMRLARQIASNAPLVVRALKHLAQDSMPRNPMQTYYPRKALLEGIAGSHDAQEGVTAFREKRAPKFEGR